MATCPECKKDVQHLAWESEVRRRGGFIVYDFDGQGLQGWFRQDEGEEVQLCLMLRCPECKEVLFTKAEDAEAFLRSGR